MYLNLDSIKPTPPIILDNQIVFIFYFNLLLLRDKLPVQ